MAISFANAAGPSQCFLIGSLLVLVGVALPVVRTKLGKSAGFDGAPTLVELYNEGNGSVAHRSAEPQVDAVGNVPGHCEFGL